MPSLYDRTRTSNVPIILDPRAYVYLFVVVFQRTNQHKWT